MLTLSPLKQKIVDILHIPPVQVGKTGEKAPPVEKTQKDFENSLHRKLILRVRVWQFNNRTDLLGKSGNLLLVPPLIMRSVLDRLRWGENTAD